MAGASGRRTSGVDRRGETSWRPVSNVPCAIVVDPYRSTAERRYAIRVSPTALRPDPSPGLRPGLLWDHAFGMEVLAHRRCISMKAQGSALGYRTRLNRSLKGCSMDPEFLVEPFFRAGRPWAAGKANARRAGHFVRRGRSLYRWNSSLEFLSMRSPHSLLSILWTVPRLGDAVFCRALRH